MAAACDAAGAGEARIMLTEHLNHRWTQEWVSYGQITVETNRCQACFEGGALVYLFSKLKKQAMADLYYVDIPVSVQV